MLTGASRKRSEELLAAAKAADDARRATVRAQEALEGMVPIAGGPPAAVVSLTKLDLKKYPFARAYDIAEVRGSGLPGHIRVVFIIRDGISEPHREFLHGEVGRIGASPVWSFDLPKITALFDEFLPISTNAHPRFRHPPLPTAPVVSPSPRESSDEDEEEEEDEEDAEELLSKPEVEVPEVDGPPDSSAPITQPVGSSEPEEDDVSTTARDAVMTRARAALGLVNKGAPRPELAVFGVFGSKSFPSTYPFLQCFDVLSERVRSAAPLDSHFHVAIVLLEVSTEAPTAASRSVFDCLSDSPRIEERVWAVPRAQFIGLLAEITGSTPVEEEPASEPVAAPQEVAKKDRAPRVTFRLLGVGEFPSDPEWTHRRFAAEQVATLPKGLSLTEIGAELFRRAELVGRKTTQGAIQQSFSANLQDDPTIATQLEMVKIVHISQTGAYVVSTYVVRNRTKRARRDEPDPPAERHDDEVVAEAEPVAAATATVHAEESGSSGRGSESGDFFAEEIPRLPKGLDQSKWISWLYSLPNAPRVARTTFRDRLYRWRDGHRNVLPAGVDPVANGHPTGSAPPPVVHEEPASPPAPVPAEPVEPPAPPPVADPAPPAPAPVVHEEPAPAPAPAPVPEAPAPPAVVPSQPAPSQAASVPDALTTMMAEFLARTEFIAGCAVRAEHERLTSRVKDVEHRNALLERFLADNPGMRAGFELFVREASRTHGSSH